MKRDLKRRFLVLLLLSGVMTAYGQNDYGVHDPCNIVKEGDRYYTFYTSNGVSVPTLLICALAQVLLCFLIRISIWITQHAPEFGGHFWAPEVAP